MFGVVVMETLQLNNNTLAVFCKKTSYIPLLLPDYGYVGTVQD
jgi:hypothetical protein